MRKIERFYLGHYGEYVSTEDMLTLSEYHGDQPGDRVGIIGIHVEGVVVDAYCVEDASMMITNAVDAARPY